ncbi:hypothetical protein ALUC_50528S [Aspergillus luchuensis]|nr:hypothetical protein ALUC_50528S [Aspergillus luchuensis]
MLALSSKSRLSFCIKAPRYHAHCRTQLKPSFQRDYASPITAETALRTALFFPGHGVQRVGMASSWVERFPKISSMFLDEMDSILGFKLSHIISEGPNSELDKTENCQPAIMATSILILRILEEEFGFMTTSRVDVTLGHSLGEFSALVAGGYLDFSDALKLVRRRAEIMSECTRAAIKRSGDEFGMIALVCEPEHMSELLSTIYEFIGLGPASLKDDSSQWYKAFRQVMVANINSRNQIVLSGNIAKIKALLIQLRQFGGHDPRACVDTVKWWDSIRYLDQTHAVTRWIGIGPGKVGRNLVGKEVGKVMVKGGGVWSISDPLEIANVLSALDKTESDPLHD